MSETDSPSEAWVEVGDLDPYSFNEYALAEGWGDGLPLIMPTGEAVERFIDTVRGDNEPIGPVPPRGVTPTMESLAANAVMAGARPEYFPVVVAAFRAVLNPDYNLHGTLATTHPCAPMLLVNGPLRETLDINSGHNCFGQGWQANTTIGRAVGLALLNIGGARPGVMDRSTQGSPAKLTFCFAENEEESPWEAYHVRRGFAASDSVVTAMAGEAPHNINDHGSNSGVGLLTTFASTISQPGANTIYGGAPYFVIVGPEHAQTLHRDRFTVESVQAELYERSKVHISNVSEENQESYAGFDRHPVDDHYYLTKSPEDIHIVVAGGAGKHSAFIPSFGFTIASSIRVSGS